MNVKSLFKYNEPRNLDLGLLILRIVFGMMMFWGHGIGKWDRLFSGNEIRFGDPIGLGPEVSFYLIVFAEGFCSLLIALGLFTRAATIPLIIGMGVAFFSYHFSDPINSMEKSFLFMMTFLVIFILGPGKFSLDHKIFKKSK